MQVHLAANDRPSIRGNNFGRSLFQQKQLALMSENLVSIGQSIMSKKTLLFGLYFQIYFFCNPQMIFLLLKGINPVPNICLWTLVR